MRKIAFITALLIGLAGCTTHQASQKPTITVSIAPLAYLVDRLADTIVEVKVLVPETTSPETYEPTVRQIGDLAASQLYFSTGLIDFEQALQTKIESVAPKTRYINLSENIKVLEGVCSHGIEGHNHAVDPHIWLSPRLMSRMAERVALELIELNPQANQHIMQNLRSLQEDIYLLDSTISKTIRDSNITNVGIVHPSLTYFANDYGIEQIEIEQEGKEPAAGMIRDLVDKMRQSKIKKILYSRQTSSASAQTVANELGIEIVEYDPLSRDWLNNMYYLNTLICN